MALGKEASLEGWARAACDWDPPSQVCDWWPRTGGEGDRQPRMHCFLASHQDLRLVPLEFREEDRGMAEVKVFIIKVLRRLLDVLE